MAGGEVVFGIDDVVDGEAVVDAGADDADDVALAEPVVEAGTAVATHEHTAFALALAARAVGIPQPATTQFKARELTAEKLEHWHPRSPAEHPTFEAAEFIQVA